MHHYRMLKTRRKMWQGGFVVLLRRCQVKITQDKDPQTIRVTLLLSNAVKHLIIEIREEQSAVSKWPLPARCISRPVNRKTSKETVARS